MEASAPKRSILRNWPVIVIVLASLAIATAVVLMIYPPASAAKADTRRLAPPPAPERMDTNPLVPPSTNGAPPKSSGIDPWSKGNPQGVQPAPSGPAPDDTDDDQLDPDDLAVDPFNSNGGGTPTDPFGALGVNPLLSNPFGNLGNMQGQFMFTMLDHACGRAKSCGNSQMASMCSTLDMFTKGAQPPSCAAGQRCLEKIDQLDCSALAGDNVLGAFGLAQECMEAITAC